MRVPFTMSKTGLGFRARSAERDLRTDAASIRSIAIAINAALTAAEKERDGLRLRLDDTLARAAVAQGNGTDDYLTREDLDTQHLNLFDAQIRNAHERLARLDENISHFQFIKDSFLTRFSKYSG